jgi:hypothetical protein
MSNAFQSFLLQSSSSSSTSSSQSSSTSSHDPHDTQEDVIPTPHTLALKKLAKKDASTRLNGLRELVSLDPLPPSTTAVSEVALAYKRLLADPLSRRDKPAMQLLHDWLARTIRAWKDRAVPLLRLVLLDWLVLIVDADPRVDVAIGSGARQALVGPGGVLMGSEDRFRKLVSTVVPLKGTVPRSAPEFVPSYPGEAKYAEGTLLALHVLLETEPQSALVASLTRHITSTVKDDALEAGYRMRVLEAMKHSSYSGAPGDKGAEAPLMVSEITRYARAPESYDYDVQYLGYLVAHLPAYVAQLPDDVCRAYVVRLGCGGNLEVLKCVLDLKFSHLSESEHDDLVEQAMLCPRVSILSCPAMVDWFHSTSRRAEWREHPKRGHPRIYQKASTAHESSSVHEQHAPEASSEEVTPQKEEEKPLDFETILLEERDDLFDAHESDPRLRDLDYLVGLTLGHPTSRALHSVRRLLLAVPDLYHAYHMRLLVAFLGNPAAGSAARTVVTQMIDAEEARPTLNGESLHVPQSAWATREADPLVLHVRGLWMRTPELPPRVTPRVLRAQLTRGDGTLRLAHVLVKYFRGVVAPTESLDVILGLDEFLCRAVQGRSAVLGCDAFWGVCNAVVQMAETYGCTARIHRDLLDSAAREVALRGADESHLSTHEKEKEKEKDNKKEKEKEKEKEKGDGGLRPPTEEEAEGEPVEMHGEPLVEEEDDEQEKATHVELPASHWLDMPLTGSDVSSGAPSGWSPALLDYLVSAGESRVPLDLSYMLDRLSRLPCNATSHAIRILGLRLLSKRLASTQPTTSQSPSTPSTSSSFDDSSMDEDATPTTVPSPPINTHLGDLSGPIHVSSFWRLCALCSLGYLPDPRVLPRVFALLLDVLMAYGTEERRFRSLADESRAPYRFLVDIPLEASLPVLAFYSAYLLRELADARPSALRAFSKNVVPRSAALALDAFVRHFVTPELLRREEEQLPKRLAESGKLMAHDKFQCKVIRAERRMVARFRISDDLPPPPPKAPQSGTVHPGVAAALAKMAPSDEVRVQMELMVPDNYPLRQVDVKTDQAKTATWVRMLVLTRQRADGHLGDVVRAWRDSVAQRMAGIEECTICYAVVHDRTRQLPKVQCKQCKNRFHAPCLRKWFTSSGNATCPLCRHVF